MNYFKVVLTMITAKMIVTMAEESPPKSKVLILGAGATGLAAAYQLDQLGIADYIILEASDTIGGRMKSVNFGKHNIQIGKFNALINHVSLEFFHSILKIQIHYQRYSSKCQGQIGCRVLTGHGYGNL